MSLSGYGHTEEEYEAEVERVWREFWLPIVGLPDGSIDMRQVKRELHDLEMCMRHCESAYEWMTGGRVSKFNTDFDAVLETAETIRSREIDEAVVDALEVEEENRSARRRATPVPCLHHIGRNAWGADWTYEEIETYTVEELASNARLTPDAITENITASSARSRSSRASRSEES